MTLKIPSLTGLNSAGAAVDVAESVFGKDYNEALIHQLVTRQLAGGRAGTTAQKNRSDVSGGGSKPWRQKGTGRARAGTTRSPLWRSGGVTFAARLQSYKQKLNKKMYRAGMCSILSELLRQSRLFVADDIVPQEAKTKELAQRLKEWGDSRLLIVGAEADNNLTLAARNLRGVNVCTADTLDPVSLVASDMVIVTRQAVNKIEERLG
jgi:large subunit ribosomal protein L4